MRIDKIVHIAGCCALVIITLAEPGFSQQPESRRSIPRFEIDPAKYHLTSQANAKIQADSSRIDSLSSATQNVDKSANRRRRFSNLQLPALQAQASADSTKSVATSTEIDISDSLADHSHENSQDSLVIASKNDVQSDTQFEPEGLATSIRKASTDASVEPKKTIIPWDAITAPADFEEQGVPAADQDATVAQANRTSDLQQRLAFIFTPGIVLAAQVSLFTTAGFFAIVFLAPALRVRFYFVFGRYHSALRLSERLLIKKPESQAILTMLTYSCFSCETASAAAQKAFENTQQLQAQPRTQKVGSATQQLIKNHDETDEFGAEILASRESKEKYHPREIAFPDAHHK